MKKLSIILICTLFFLACKTTAKVEVKEKVTVDSAATERLRLHFDSIRKSTELEVKTLKTELSQLRLTITDLSTKITDAENVRVLETLYGENGNIQSTKSYERTKNTSTENSSKTVSVEYVKELKQKYDSLIRIQDTQVKLIMKKQSELEKILKRSAETDTRIVKKAVLIAIVIFFMFIGALVYIYVRPYKKVSPNLNLPKHPLHPPKA